MRARRRPYPHRAGCAGLYVVTAATCALLILGLDIYLIVLLDIALFLLAFFCAL